ncbi:von Willebrand factor, type A [Luminiphilus syltensis NOR5-1B]|uniref:von Willebrand factor, type A n=1 Tax=Luminiphilus syltensis NOR5-1B TaxID=565045 RepID=B8KXW8_9GAMM|nr:VWA domain-containing protein [Luminiphilus syltensis]EED34360.1 von Willebrand factor, type A [Luminiphilus syltensis NOR5-1B]
MFEILWPWVFVALPLPIIVRLFRAGENAADEGALRAPFASRWQVLKRGTGRLSNRPSAALWILWAIWLLLVLALSRPQWVGDPIELPSSGRDLMLAIDLSGSMQIEDMQVGARLVSRIEAVKAIASDFTSQRVGDRVGLILFGTRAYVQAPLTFDTATVTRFIREAQLGFAGEDTAIGDALGLAIKRLRERPAESRVLILLTDGQDTASTVDPMEATALAAESGIKVYTIGISRRIGARAGGSGEVDEALLNAIAEATGGEYFRARNPAELQSIYGVVDQLEPIEQNTSTFRPKRALGYLPLSAALALALASILWRSRPNFGSIAGAR